MIGQAPNILDVMKSEDVFLRKTGRTYRGKCPIHDGTSSGSLTVYPDSQSWFCWGCGEGGDAIDFIQKKHGVGFKDALAILGIRKGKPNPIDPAKEKRRQLLKAFECWRRQYYCQLCNQLIDIHNLRIKAERRKPLPEALAFWLAEKLGQIPLIKWQLDILSGNDEQAKLNLFKGMIE
jgi:DNA primase